MFLPLWFLVIAIAIPQARADNPENVEPVAQSENGETPHQLEDIVVTATRTENDPFEVPAYINTVDEKDIKERLLSRTVPEALKETAGVMVQKTSHGQGSTYIRGLTGFRTLFLIDGIRLNNSVFRDGPNQYWTTVDPLSLDRLEIVKGPSSVLYGSDAVAGTVNAITRSRKEFGEGFLWDRSLYYRYSSAEDAHVGRAEISGSFDQDLGFLLGGSLKDYGDVRGGHKFGLQRKTGYDEVNGDFKLEYFPDVDSKLVLALQSADINDAWRTHKTVYGISWEGTSIGSELRRDLDQTRKLTYAQYSQKNIGPWIDEIKTSISYQVQEEDQFRIKNDTTSDKQGFDVRTLGVSLQMESDSQTGKWTCGAEYYRDSVDSFRKKFNPDGSLDSIEIQGPVADDSHYDLLGIYLQNEIPVSKRLDLILGARYNYAAADADSMEDPVSGNETSLDDSWDTVVGSARLLYGLDQTKNWNLFMGVSQGFRAPNLSDLTRLDTARSNEIETPSPDLDPEKFISGELGVKTRYENWSGQIAYYYTDIQDLVVRTPTGNIIDGDAEVIKKNSGDGYVHGIELDARYRFLPCFTAFTSFSWLYGEVETFPTSTSGKKTDTLDRLMPPMGNLGVRWDHESLDHWIEAVCNFADKADKLSERDKADTQRIPPGGTPGYFVFHLRSGWKIMKDLTLSVAIENISNVDYRIHGSGQNEPGRSIVMGVDFRF
ncbi:MAG: TonB-dependent receptor plug domain-containing protein [Planctomycetota bacterium]|jgi:hemoglobin/transferrin/lactoferrin receptor protein